MQMGPLQIASEYRTGKNKSKTIKALAELNLCTQREIAELLQAQGETLPGHWAEKLAQRAARQKKANDAPARESGEETAETAAPEQAAKSDPGERDTTPTGTAVDDGRGGAVLSLDEIRQTALELILDRSPGEPTRFQGYALGVAALARELENKMGRRAE